MRYLLAIWDGGGATPPNLGVARMLVERGHEVVAYGDATLAADVVRDGGDPTGRGRPRRSGRSTALEDDLLKDWECRTPLGAAHRILDRLIAGPSTRFAADITAALDDEQFDAVLADGMLLGALIGAEARGVPAATLVGSVYLAPSRVRPPMGRIPTGPWCDRSRARSRELRAGQPAVARRYSQSQRCTGRVRTRSARVTCGTSGIARIAY